MLPIVIVDSSWRGTFEAGVYNVQALRQNWGYGLNVSGEVGSPQ